MSNAEALIRNGGDDWSGKRMGWRWKGTDTDFFYRTEPILLFRIEEISRARQFIGEFVWFTNMRFMRAYHFTYE